MQARRQRKSMATVLVLGGLRPDELLAVRWEHVALLGGPHGQRSHLRRAPTRRIARSLPGAHSLLASDLEPRAGAGRRRRDRPPIGDPIDEEQAPTT
jgi:integrase